MRVVNIINEAIHLAKTGNIDLYICEVRLPDARGADELYERIREFDLRIAGPSDPSPSRRPASPSVPEPMPSVVRS